MSEQTSLKEKPRRFFDMTVNVQSLAIAVVGGICAVTIAYAGVVSRVDRLEAREQGQDERMSRIEKSVEQQRTDTKDQLNAIGRDVKEISNYLLNNTASQRPDISRWSRR